MAFPRTLSRCAAAMLMVAAACFAQTTASILGSVTDESGAVVAGATVVATNTQTNEVRSAQTNEVGNYNFPALPVGSYTLRCERDGFKKWVREGIELSLNRNARVDIQMSVGGVAESVTVTGDVPLVEATSAEMGALIDRKRVTELPLNGRNTLTLVALAPGAQPLQTGDAQGFVENKVNVNGGRQENSNFLLDGGDNTSNLRNYGNDVPNPDAIQEFKLMTNNYDAEFGRSSGAIVNVITRSGTNQYHGTLFEFLRNRQLNARNFFEPDTSPLVQNQYGGTFGGPVRKDKTFFFGSFQSFRVRTSSFKNVAQVPTALERDGDFSQSFDKSGKLLVVNDPATKQPFANNVVPKDRLSQVALNYLKLALPVPNIDTNRAGTNLQQRASVPRDNDQFLIKLDHLFSERHKLSGGYFWSDNIDGNRFLTDIDFARRDIKARQQNLNVHEYWTVDATKLNHFRATYARSAGDRHVTPDNTSLNDLGAKFSPLPSGPMMPPDFTVNGYFDSGSAYGGPKISNNFTLADTFDWMKGRHNLKIGAEGWLRRLFDTSAHPGMGGEFTFDGSASGNALADMMLGKVYKLRVVDNSYKSMSSWAFYWFAQDKIRLNRKLTVDLGVRYEWNGWPVAPSNQLIAYLPGRHSTCVPQAPDGILFPCDDGVPRSGVRPDKNDFGPRIGLAYDPFGDGKTILRAGYGIYYAFTIFNVQQGQQTSIPFVYDQTLYNTTLEDPYSVIGGSPFPFLRDPANLKFPLGVPYSYQDYNMRNGYVQQYNFSFQRQVSKDWMVEAAYVGNTGRKLTSTVDDNAPVVTAGATSKNIDQRRPMWPTFQALIDTGNFVNSSYNALQTRVERRFSGGFTLLGSYTLSKALDIASWHDSRTSWLDMRNLALDRGRADYDRRQSLVASWVWDLPVLRSGQGWASRLFGGWSLNGIASFYSGAPFSPLSDKDIDVDGNSKNDRPKAIGQWVLDPSRSRDQVIRAWFLTSAFSLPSSGMGNAGRNIISGPGSKNVDLGAFKKFHITESTAVDFRAEAFNALNWVNLNTPENRMSKGTFGQVLSASAPRIYQLGLKFVF